MADVKTAPRPTTDGAKGSAVGVANRGGVPGRSPAWPASPFTLMRRFAEDMDRIFEDFGFGAEMRTPAFMGRAREAADVPAEWSPRVEVQRREGQLVVRADLPGLTKDDIKVEVTRDALTIQGERKAESKEEREGYSYSECSYGRFYRSIPMPEGVDPSKVTADFKNGVLEVGIPAPPQADAESQARRIEVREKS